MELEFDSRKNTQNIAKHGVSFDDLVNFEWTGSITTPDDRFDYREHRSVSYGMLNDRLHVLIWTMRNDKIRPISFRKANKRERDFYEKKKKSTESRQTTIH
ncbi:MAG: BrnT family toxin [Pseudomonadota bacterium]